MPTPAAGVSAFAGSSEPPWPSKVAGVSCAARDSRRTGTTTRGGSMGAGIGGEAGTEQGRYGGQTWGDFELGEPLGRGPRGTVYRARQLSLDRPVAVKVLDLTLSEDSAFRR